MDVRRLYEIECAVLSTLLYADDYGIEKIQINPEHFYHPFNKRVAEYIHKLMQRDRCLGILIYKLTDVVEGTQWEVNWLDILAQTPVAGLSEYYNIIKRDAIAREVHYAA